MKKSAIEEGEWDIYLPESPLRHSRRFFKSMFQDLFLSCPLAWELMKRDIQARYRRSFLGYFWCFVPALMMAMGFTFAVKAKVIHFGPTEIPYPAYVMLNMLLWQTFVEALNGPLEAALALKTVLARIKLRRESIVVAKVGEVGFNFLVKLFLIIPLFLFFKISVSLTVIFAPFAVLLLIMLGTFFGLIIAPLGILYEDVSKALPLVTGFWLFLTPVVYPISISDKGLFISLVHWNPVTPLLSAVRELATVGVLSDPFGFCWVAVTCVLGVGAAWVLYRLAFPIVIERLGA